MKKTINVTRSSMPGLYEYVDEIKSLWDSHWITNMGEKHKKLQAALKEYLEVEQIELLVNGHMALEMTLQAMNLKGEVITTPFTFASTTHAIIRNGLEPVFCDINTEDYTIDVNQIEKLITDRTCAIMPVHIYGNICDVEQIEMIAKEYGLRVIYDAAHAFGETYKGIPVGRFGDASCFSFHATKVFNTIEGGAVAFRDEQLGKSLYDLKNFGIHGPEEVSAVGANAKMNEFCAAMGLCNLRHIDDEIKKRKAVDDRYRKNFKGVTGLTVGEKQTETKYNYSYFPVLIGEDFGANRDEVFKSLANQRISARKYFFPLTNSFSAFNGKYDSSETPRAVDISNRVLTLPLYPDLSLDDVDRICEVIAACKK